MKQGRIVVLALLVVGAAVLALAAGPTGWRWTAAVDLVGGDPVVAGLRAPRVLVALLVGGSLAVAGVTMQTLLGNDLADPYVLGLSGGAALGAVASLALLPGWPPGPAAAVGAAGAAWLVGGVARRREPARLLLAGVTVGSLLMSATGVILVLLPAASMVRSATFWLFGGLGTPAVSTLVAPAVLLAGCLAFLLPRAERLDRLVLGDDVAASLGVDVRRTRRQALVCGVLLTAAAVGVGGLVGFVGLVGPHAARRLFGASHRGLLPASALCGALLVVLADTLARTAFAPREIPVGLVTALAGGPLFLMLLRRRMPWAA